MATWNDLFDAALTTIGVLDAGGTGAAADRTYCLGVTNRMLGAWSAEMGPIHFETTESLTWASGEASRTIGPSGNLDTARPLQVLSAQYRIGDLDYPLTLITHQQYQAIDDKALEVEMPSYLAYNPTIASGRGELLIWPIPSGNLAFRLTSLKPFTAISDQTATVVLPPGYEDAIVPNLAKRIASAFGRSLSPDDAQQARASKTILIQANTIPQPMQLDPMAPGQQSGYNGRLGWNIP